uniref:Uncharacterized protein n=1 Tax=Anguilla anguilla TaxID=7936 RepID=A0A0E9S7S2_ANGAN
MFVSPDTLAALYLERCMFAVSCMNTPNSNILERCC